LRSSITLTINLSLGYFNTKYVAPGIVELRDTSGTLTLSRLGSLPNGQALPPCPADLFTAGEGTWEVAMVRRETESVDDCIESRLTHLAQEALNELCANGCDRQRLLGLFGWLASYKPIPIGRKMVDLRELDSRTSAHPGFSLPKLRKIAVRAERLRAEVSDLRRTPLVRTLVEYGAIEEGDLLASSPLFPGDASRAFAGLIELPRFAKLCGSQKKPNYTRLRKNIHTYIYDCTDSWHDRLFVAVYNDLFPKDQQDEKEVQRWRKRHGLIHPSRNIPKTS